MNQIIIMKKITKIHLEKNICSNIQEVHILLKIVLLKEILIFKKILVQINDKLLMSKNIFFCLIILKEN